MSSSAKDNGEMFSRLEGALHTLSEHKYAVYHRHVPFLPLLLLEVGLKCLIQAKDLAKRQIWPANEYQIPDIQAIINECIRYYIKCSKYARYLGWIKRDFRGHYRSNPELDGWVEKKIGSIAAMIDELKSDLLTVLERGLDYLATVCIPT